MAGELPRAAVLRQHVVQRALVQNQLELSGVWQHGAAVVEVAFNPGEGSDVADFGSVGSVGSDGDDGRITTTGRRSVRAPQQKSTTKVCVHLDEGTPVTVDGSQRSVSVRPATKGLNTNAAGAAPHIQNVYWAFLTVRWLLPLAITHHHQVQSKGVRIQQRFEVAKCAHPLKLARIKLASHFCGVCLRACVPACLRARPPLYCVHVVVFFAFFSLFVVVRNVVERVSE